MLIDINRPPWFTAWSIFHHGTRFLLFTLSLSIRNQLHLQRAQLQQALLDVGGGVEFAERLLSCGSDAEILSAKGVTLRRLTSLAESSYDPHPATVDPDDGSGISFMPREPAGEVDGYPVVGVINSRTVDLSKCTIEGEGKPLLTYSVLLRIICKSDVFNSCFMYSVMFLFCGSRCRQAGGNVGKNLWEGVGSVYTELTWSS